MLSRFAVAHLVYGSAASISVVLNLILLAILKFCPAKSLGWFKNILYCYVAKDCTYSITAVLLAPYFFSGVNEVFVQMQGVLGGGNTAGPLFFICLNSNLAELTLVAIAFSYRLSSISRSKFKVIFYSPILYLIVSCMLLFESSCAFINGQHTELNAEMHPELEREFNEHIFYAVSIKTMTPLNMLLSCFISGFSSLKYSIIIFCGIRINRHIRDNTYSEKTSSMHVRALRMMIALNPFFFSLIPISMHYAGLVFDTRNWNFVCFLAALHPINNPLIVLVMTEEYRQRIFGFSSTKVTVSTVSVLSSGV